MSTDLTFLRRRSKRPAPAPAVTHTPPPQATPSVTILVTARDVTLTAESPVTRLSRYASGIGSLRIHGVTEAFVEDADGVSYPVGAAQMPAPGNRPLAQMHDGDLIVGLRHLRRVRRVVTAGMDMTVTTASGLTVRIAGDADLGIHVISGHLELRRDHRCGDLAHTYALGGPACPPPATPSTPSGSR